MQLGKHVYVQKPLAHTVFEARQMQRLAKKYGVVTQMGNQGHSGSGYRTVVKLVQDGAIGKVKEAHAWSNRPIWPQGIERPKEAAPVPEHLHWDKWLGVAPYRPYAGDRREKGAGGTAARIIRSTGAAGWISASARWATWAATSSIRSSGAWSLLRR